ncbi:hypothetical protein NDQ71_20595 [Pseudoalteromonas sp. KG3]|uniref:hypothetical protein n=1 Tax=Pseudoalteromonas sp. KG3 TaxID=2951137 RepID=UPI00265A1446|nr:hypothetical protein [Pseudoalteromonas sp. KG3]WKD26188.1 hypothetical protein NDQ71_20595 [Pseudoalteromonas sp. KG3]
MQQSLNIARVEKHFTRYIADIPYLYFNKHGDGLIGIAFHIANKTEFAKLNLRNKHTKQLAGRDEKTAEFIRSSRLPKGYAVNFYEPFGELYLPHSESLKLLSNRVSALITELQDSYKKPAFKQLPLAVQLSLLDMTYELKQQSLADTYPDFHTAIKQQDWLLASEHCHREHVSKARNNKIKSLLKNAKAPNKNWLYSFKNWLLQLR